MADEPVPSIVIGGIEHAATIAAALRRSSSLNTGNHPTRTLRITASEKNSSRDNTPISISAEELTRRPRSNPRSRTPMRYESPLQTDAFRASSPSPVQEDSRRFSIRPLTGMAVGTVSRIVEDRRSARPVAVTKSTKQGPSHRKIRRWNNEHFDGLAAEISSRGGAVAAQVLLYAQREAHLYRSIYDPKDHGQAENIKRFMQDENMKGARENFFEGEGPNPGATCHKNPRDSHKKVLLTANDMLYRIDPRLRRLAVRACRNSYAAAKVVGMFEEFVLGSFTINKSMKGIQSLDDDCWWKDLLLECPTITQRKDNHRHTAQFFFHSSSPTGGFHRLLLHAVCQFHGLNAASKMEHNYVSASNDVTKARALIVTGIIDDSSRNRLLGQLDDDVDVLPNSTVRCSPAMEQQMLALQV